MNTEHKIACPYLCFSEDPGDNPLAWAADGHFGIEPRNYRGVVALFSC